MLIIIIFIIVIIVNSVTSIIIIIIINCPWYFFPKGEEINEKKLNSRCISAGQKIVLAGFRMNCINKLN